MCYIHPMTSLLVATSNPGKRREYEQLLAPLELELCSPQDLKLSITVREVASTYAENARIKALHYLKASGLQLNDAQREGRRTIFVFEDTGTRRALVRDFYNGGTVRVNDFTHAIQDLKAVVYNW